MGQICCHCRVNIYELNSEWESFCFIILFSYHGFYFNVLWIYWTLSVVSVTVMSVTLYCFRVNIFYHVIKNAYGSDLCVLFLVLSGTQLCRPWRSDQARKLTGRGEGSPPRAVLHEQSSMSSTPRTVLHEVRVHGELCIKLPWRQFQGTTGLGHSHQSPSSWLTTTLAKLDRESNFCLWEDLQWTSTQQE